MKARENVLDYVCIYNPWGKVLWTSRADPTLGFTNADIVGRTIHEIATPETSPELGVAFSHAMMTRTTTTALAVIESNGSRSSFAVTFHPILESESAAIVSHAFPIPALHLTPREIEVARLIASDLTTKQIAARLIVSVSTVETHRKSISVKLGGAGIAGITMFCVKHGLLAP